MDETKRLMSQIEDQKEQIQLLTEQVAYLSRKLFGTSSEKSQNENQLSFFQDEPEVFRKRRQPKKKPSKRS